MRSMKIIVSSSSSQQWLRNAVAGCDGEGNEIMAKRE
jgi:hypothetical protein